MRGLARANRLHDAAPPSFTRVLAHFWGSVRCAVDPDYLLSGCNINLVDGSVRIGEVVGSSPITLTISFFPSLPLGGCSIKKVFCFSYLNGLEKQHVSAALNDRA